MENLYVVILAAGKGTRMKSLDVSRSKVSFPILGKPLVEYVLEAVLPLQPQEIITVVGFGGEQTIKIVEKHAKYVWQHEQHGTGHAVQQAAHLLEDREGLCLVICGDTPLLTTETLQRLIDGHRQNHKDATVLTAMLDNPHGYGRIIRNDKGEILEIVEQADTDNENRKINEVNTGVYVFDNKHLFKALHTLGSNNKQGEIYLTDTLASFRKQGLLIGASVLKDHLEMLGINDRAQLAEATKIMQNRINSRHMRNGVTIIDPQNTYIGPDVTIGQDTIIYPSCTILGKTSIGNSNVIKTCTWIEDSIIGDGNEIGPMANLRAKSNVVGENRIGAFVEMKNTTMKKGAKAAHLSYLGDAFIGEKTNVGGGTITANYNGIEKFVTEIGDNVFVGTGVTIIAPCTIGNGAYIAGGSTINQSVDQDDLAIGRAYQVNKKGYAVRYRKK